MLLYIEQLNLLHLFLYIHLCQIVVLNFNVKPIIKTYFKNRSQMQHDQPKKTNPKTLFGGIIIIISLRTHKLLQIIMMAINCC